MSFSKVINLSYAFYFLSLNILVFSIFSKKQSLGDQLALIISINFLCKLQLYYPFDSINLYKTPSLKIGLISEQNNS